MNLLDLYEQREPYQQGIDQLEARRIDTLNDRMQDLLARAQESSYKNNPAAVAALKKQFQQVKDERDSYHKVREGSVTPTATGLRHQARPGTYGGYEPEADPLAKLDKPGTNKLEKAMGVKFDREKKYQGGLDVDEAGIPGNVPTEKIPGKEDLLKGKGRSYYEDQKKNLNLSKGVIPTEPLPEHGGGIGPKQHWQDLMPEQSNPEDDDWYDDEDDQETELRSGDYVRDTMDGEHGEIFRMQGDPYERRVRILDRDGKGWYIEPGRLTRVDPTDPDVQRYFGRKRQRDMDESGVAEGFKYIGDRRKFFALRKKSVQELDGIINSATSSTNDKELAKKVKAEKQKTGVDEGWSDAIVAQRTGQPQTPYGVYIDGKQWKEFATDDQARAVARKLEAKFKADGTNKKVSFSPAESYMKKDVKEDQDTSGVESAIIRRIMVAHTDLLKQFGPDKVMQAAEEVAYNVGDVDEIGTSDVSAYVAQVKQILGATP